MVETKTTKYGSYMVVEQVKIHDEFCEWAKTAKNHETKVTWVKCRRVVIELDDSMSGDEVDQKLHERLHAEPFDGEEVTLRLSMTKTPLRLIANVEHITDDVGVKIPVGYSVSMYPEEVGETMWFVLAAMFNDPRTFG